MRKNTLVVSGFKFKEVGKIMNYRILTVERGSMKRVCRAYPHADIAKRMKISEISEPTLIRNSNGELFISSTKNENGLKIIQPLFLLTEEDRGDSFSIMSI